MTLFLAIVVYAMWSTVFPLMKMALNLAPVFFLTGSRMALAGVLILGYLLLFHRSSLKISLKQFFSIAILGFLSVYLSNVFECLGLQHLTAAKTCFIYSLGPFFSAFFSYLHFGEVMSVRKWIGMCIGFAGILPVLYSQKGGEELISSIPLISWPELAVMGASLCSVYGWVILRKLIKNVPPTTANGGSMLIGGIFALLHSVFAENWAPIPVEIGEWGSFTALLFIMILISNLLCYNLYGMLLKRFTATILSFLGLFSPIFTSLSSWILLGEVPSLVIFASTGIVLFGLWMVYGAELRQGYLSPIRAK